MSFLMVKQQVMPVLHGELSKLTFIHLHLAILTFVTFLLTYSTCTDGNLACYIIDCAFPDCTNYYTPEGACCPVCAPYEVEGR